MIKQNELRSMTLEELEQVVVEAGEKAFRAKQVFEWLHKKRVSSIDEMTNISKKLREHLKENYTLDTLNVAKELISSIDGTRKYLFELSDGNIIESVWMKYKHGNSVCISSQVGCRMGCKFCASTLDGLERNLRPSEMLEQIYRIVEITNERIDSVVIMGSGEPMDNYDNVVRFLHLITDKNGMGLSRRGVTLSTCGIVPRIYDLANENIQCTLSVSLHASNDEKRSSMMPVNNAYNIEELMQACRDYIAITNKRISFEYALAKDNNDNLEDAKELVNLLKGMLCHVNLIPINKIENGKFTKSSNENIIKFRDYLNDHGIVATIRRDLGSDIDAACGQLRRQNLKENKTN